MFYVMYLTAYVQFAEHIKVLLSGLTQQRAVTKSFHLPEVLAGREDSHICLSYEFPLLKPQTF